MDPLQNLLKCIHGGMVFEIFSHEKLKEVNTLFNKESIKIIKNVFKEKFENPEKYIDNLNYDRMVKKLREEVKNSGKEI